LPEHSPQYPNELNGEVSLLSFVIRLWKEESISQDEQTNWRGHITPIPNGTRHYFTNISEIPALIAAHLKFQR
jgi:hypothetical protein